MAELNEVHPTYLPSVPRLFEKIFTLVSANTDPGTLADATRVGLQVRELQMAGKEIPEELQAPFAAAEEKLFANVRAVFGGRLREALTGAAPIGKEILERHHGSLHVRSSQHPIHTGTVFTVFLPFEAATR